MASETAGHPPRRETWETISDLIAADGSARQPMASGLISQDATLRDLADAAHALCAVHARHPGVMEHALNGREHHMNGPWLASAADAFAREKAYLIQLTVAVGPLPSTPGQPESDAAIAALSRALDLLAQSDREGCALGAAVALVEDWFAVRKVLDAAAIRVGINPAPMALPNREETATLVAAFADQRATERALFFGADQLLAQHRGLWDLLDTRAQARNIF